MTEPKRRGSFRGAVGLKVASCALTRFNRHYGATSGAPAVEFLGAPVGPE
jgi:hypothetical protein